jgi:transcriptional regulator with XRE-family HTH domain
MPRPSKHVSPDTLGGRIRAAREHLHLSLAEVASGQYSTSLISQIERNRVDPSQESLRFLADRLKLPIDDLKILAYQHRESEVEAREYTSFDTLRSKAAQLLAEKQVGAALDMLAGLHFAQVPPLQRWRLAALRGQCYFEHRAFVKAQGDFVYATQEEPNRENLPPDQKQELLLLHLHLAATYRELYQLDEALEQFKQSLAMMSRETPLGYVAEARWGMALIALTQAKQMQQDISFTAEERERKLHDALEHADYARLLYETIGETLNAASVECNIAEIEQALGHRENTRSSLTRILEKWPLPAQEAESQRAEVLRRQKEQANVVSTAACLLAEIELEDNHYDNAMKYAQLALEAGKRSYILRRADAYIMQARIFEATYDESHDKSYAWQVEQAYHNALDELAKTERIGIRISTHVRFGGYLLKHEKPIEGQQELAKAAQLSNSVLIGTNSTREEVAV